MVAAWAATTPTAASASPFAPAHCLPTARPPIRHRGAPLVCVIAARRAAKPWELVGADGDGGARRRPRACTGTVGGLEHREHRAGAAGRVGTGEAPEEGGGSARGSGDPARFTRTSTLGFVPLPRRPFPSVGQASVGRGRGVAEIPQLPLRSVPFPASPRVSVPFPPLLCVPFSRFPALQASSRTSGAVPPKEEELRAAVEVLRAHGLHSVLEEWFVEVLQNDLQANISLEFWNTISQRENCADEPQCLLLLLDAFGLLESRLDPYLHSLELLEKWTRLGLLMGAGAQGLREKVHTTLRGVLFFSTPRTFQEMIQRLYGRFLRVYMQSKRKGEGGTDPELEGELDSRYARRRYYRLLQSPLCAGCGSDKQQCWCRQALEQFHQLSQVL